MVMQNNSHLKLWGPRFNSPYHCKPDLSGAPVKKKKREEEEGENIRKELKLQKILSLVRITFF